eukprot:EG_transcript_6636
MALYGACRLTGCDATPDRRVTPAPTALLAGAAALLCLGAAALAGGAQAGSALHLTRPVEGVRLTSTAVGSSVAGGGAWNEARRDRMPEAPQALAEVGAAPATPQTWTAGLLPLVMAPLLAGLMMLPLAERLRRRTAPASGPADWAMAAVDLAEVDARFPPLRNDNALRAIRGQSPDRIPVWAMRQAGRYLPEYVEYTKDKEFFSRCQNPEVACHLTLQPFERYDLDAGIIFSDILVVPQALGMEVKMVKGQGPVFPTALRTKEDWYAVERKLLERLGVTGVPTEKQDEEIIKRAPEVANALSYVYEAITLTRTRLNGRAPLIGFCGAPWTLFVYASEAKKTKTYTEVSRWIYTEPEFVHRILRVMAHVCAQYLIRQVQAGAQMLQVFESHANVLPPKQWKEFALPYLNLIAMEVKAECPGIPMIVLPKDAPFALELLKDSPYDMVSIDPTLDLGKSHAALTAVGKGVQGNMSPTTMYAPPAKVGELVRDYLNEAFGEAGPIPKRYIANLGSGMNPDMDPECLGAFVEAVHAYGKPAVAAGEPGAAAVAV